MHPTSIVVTDFKFIAFVVNEKKILCPTEIQKPGSSVLIFYIRNFEKVLKVYEWHKLLKNWRTFQII